MGMSNHLEALRARVKAMEEGRPKSKRWKPKDEHTVRVLPLDGQEEDLGFTIKWHYGVDNGRQMYCPSTHGDDCEFCELGKKLKSWKDEDGRDKTEAKRKLDWEFFKKIDAATKWYVPVIVRKKDTTDVEGPFLWEMTPKTYQTVLKVCIDEDYNAEHGGADGSGGGLKILTSPEYGHDLNVSLKKKGEKGNNTSYDLTEVKERKRGSVLLQDKAKVADILSKIPRPTDIAQPITTAQAEKVFAAWSGSMTKAASSDEGGEVEYNDANGEEPATGGLNVEDTVAKLEGLLEKQ